METNNLSRIRQRARKLHSKYNLSVPIDLDVILREKSISVSYKENQYGIDGLCQLQKNPPAIILNSEMTYEPRRRFTIAHELGHICIPWHTGVDLCSLDDPHVRIKGQKMLNTQELEANFFASELLMPTEWIKNTFDLTSESLENLIKKISKTAQTSIMACLYALENVLPAGELFFVRTDSGEFWRPFKSDDTGSIRVAMMHSFAFYDEVCHTKNEFKIANYNIIHYKLNSLPPFASLNGIYQACGSDLGLFLNAISDNHPIRVMHSIDAIINELKDRLYIFVKIGDSFFRSYKNENTSIRIHIDECGAIDELYQYIKENFRAYGHVTLSADSTLLWIRERQRNSPAEIYRGDPQELLRGIVNEIYEQESAHHMFMSINGVISGLNGKYAESSYEDLFHLAKLRFDTDPYYIDFRCHPRYEEYISGKAANLVSKRRRIHG